MRKILVSILALGWLLYLGHAQALSPSTIRILPEDVEQGSIQQVRFTTNQFAVRWTYTEAGARKMLAFWEGNVGKETTEIIGSFETRPAVNHSPRDAAGYNKFKESWGRTD